MNRIIVLSRYDCYIRNLLFRLTVFRHVLSQIISQDFTVEMRSRVATKLKTITRSPTNCVFLIEALFMNIRGRYIRYSASRGNKVSRERCNYDVRCCVAQECTAKSHSCATSFARNFFSSGGMHPSYLRTSVACAVMRDILSESASLRAQPLVARRSYDDNYTHRGLLLLRLTRSA